jgi:hypothetical protein
MSRCPTCGKTSPPCPETGYDGDDFCSEKCEEKAMSDSGIDELREKVVKAALDYAFASELPYDLRRAVRELRETETAQTKEESEEGRVVHAAPL